MNSKREIILLQIGGWLLYIALFYFYISQRLYHVPVTYRLGLTITSFISYVIIIYGYVYFLYPRFKNSRLKLVISTLLLFSITMLIRLILEKEFVSPLNTNYVILDYSNIHLSYNLVSCLLALIIGILFTAVTEKISMQKRQEVLKRKQLEAELNLLKYQLQPHFLFNFLNNLYADVYKVLPEVANQVEQGANIMRYFLYNTTEEKVPISSETDFILNLIDLEKSRLSNNFNIKLDLNIEEEVMIPPMLFAPLIENLFKHGIPVNGQNQEAIVCLQSTKNRVTFSVTNPLTNRRSENGNGVGLRNLEERLKILYQNNYSLTINSVNNLYSIKLSIPVNEN